MAITFNVIATNSTPAHPLSINPGATADDVLIASVVTDTGAVNSWAISGFDQLDHRITSVDGSSHGTLRKKDATGSEGGLNITNDISAAMIGFIMALSGADNTTPEDVAIQAATDNTGEGSPWIIDVSITPVTDGCMIVAIMNSDVAGAANAVHSFSTVSGTTGAWTVRADLNSGYYNIAVATAPQTTAGAITVRGTGTLGGYVAAQTMVLMAIRPAAGGAADYPYRPVQTEPIQRAFRKMAMS